MDTTKIYRMLKLYTCMHAGPHAKMQKRIIKDENKTAVRKCTISKATGRAKAVKPVITCKAQSAFHCHTSDSENVGRKTESQQTSGQLPLPLVVTNLCCTGDKHSHYADQR